jgi:hypothetical protein
MEIFRQYLGQFVEDVVRYEEPNPGFNGPISQAMP